MKKQLKKEVGKRLRQFRNKTGLTQREIATHFDIGRANYSRIETGEVFPGISMLMTLQEKFNLCLDWLVGERGEMHLNVKKKDPVLEQLENDLDEVKELFLLMNRVPLVKHAVLSFFLEFKANKETVIAEYMRIAHESRKEKDEGKN